VVRRQLLGRCLEPFRVAGQQGEIRPLARERRGDGEPDAAAAAGDDGALAGKLQILDDSVPARGAPVCRWLPVRRTR
jgi:hypothetical protein